jgi:hypothetical protein
MLAPRHLSMRGILSCGVEAGGQSHWRLAD